MTPLIVAAWVLIVPPVVIYREATSGFSAQFATLQACEAVRKQLPAQYTKGAFCAPTGAQ